MLTLTKFLHSSFGQISAIIRYNAVWKAKAKNHLFDELNSRCRVTLTDRLCLDPLCEFVNRHQKVGLFILGTFKRPNHIKPPVMDVGVLGTGVPRLACLQSAAWLKE